MRRNIATSSFEIEEMARESQRGKSLRLDCGREQVLGYEVR